MNRNYFFFVTQHATETFLTQKLNVKKRFGGMLSDKEKHIVNLSDYSLSDTEKFVLSNGLDCCLPPKSINREEVFAEFGIETTDINIC